MYLNVHVQIQDTSMLQTENKPLPPAPLFHCKLKLFVFIMPPGSCVDIKIFTILTKSFEKYQFSIHSSYQALLKKKNLAKQQ